MKITIEADVKEMNVLLGGSKLVQSDVDVNNVALVIHKSLQQDPLLRKRIVEGF